MRDDLGGPDRDYQKIIQLLEAILAELKIQNAEYYVDPLLLEDTDEA